VKGIALAGIVVCTLFLALLVGLVVLGAWKRLCFGLLNIEIKGLLGKRCSED
jgi:hypothetical protein